MFGTSTRRQHPGDFMHGFSITRLHSSEVKRVVHRVFVLCSTLLCKPIIDVLLTKSLILLCTLNHRTFFTVVNTVLYSLEEFTTLYQL